MKKLIYDVGMFDGSDTQYYLNKGYRVLAIEANTVLVKYALEKKFSEYIKNGDLTILNFAVTNGSEENISLKISATEQAASTTLKDANYYNYGEIIVKTITLQELFNKYGIPYYLKLDIELEEKNCILSINKDRPKYLSTEIRNNSLIPVLKHLESIGFNKFKLINQNNFREINNQNNLYDFLSNKIIRRLGYKHPRYIKRNGDFFKPSYSSGPLPWFSDGEWALSKDIISIWEYHFKKSSLQGWYDLHAK